MVRKNNTRSGKIQNSGYSEWLIFLYFYNILYILSKKGIYKMVAFLEL